MFNHMITVFSVFSAQGKMTLPFYPVISAPSCHSKEIFQIIFSQKNDNILIGGHIFKFKGKINDFFSNYTKMYQKWL